MAVSQLNAYIKNSFDSDFLLQNIWVQGEISNFKLHYSGHMYLSLKDEGGVIRAVMFRAAAGTLSFVPENGMQVLARGRISVYPRDGAYQLYIEEMEPEGAGALYVAFEQLKAKLDKEGLFSPERKKPIPAFPACVGVVTSATGAAVQDILNILSRRWPLAKVELCPVLVQGEGAAKEIAAAIYALNEKEDIDVLIVGRGGGSQEDLWAFNEECVARAVSASHIPVISGVGHETDFTICDFVSDLRAPTPSAAAELAVPDKSEILAGLASLEKQLSKSLSLVASRSNEKLGTLLNRLISFQKRMDEYAYALDDLSTALVNQMSANLQVQSNRFTQMGVKLDALSPLKVLTRGYAFCEAEDGIVDSVSKLTPAKQVRFTFADGAADCTVDKVERKISNEL